MTADIVAPNCHVGDKVLHYNHKAAQQQGDKTVPKLIGPYTIVKVHDKGNYTVEDKNGKQLATKVCASNLYLRKELIASDFLTFLTPDFLTGLNHLKFLTLLIKLKNSLTAVKRRKKSKIKRNRRRKLNQMYASRNCMVMTFLLLLVNVKILSNTSLQTFS